MKHSHALFLVTTSSTVLLCLVFPIVGVVGASENSWETLKPMPTARSRLGVTTLNGKIYAIGGSNQGENLNVNEMYDPATDTWTTRQPMPTARYSLAIAAYRNKIYCIGGAVMGSSGPVPTGANEVYDPQTNTWQEIELIPTPRYALCANVVNGKIYLIGGSSGAPTYHWFSLNEMYDPDTNTWHTKAPLPTAVWGYESAVVDDKIYIIGGSGTGNLLQIYDTQMDTWSYGASCPTRISGGAAGATLGAWAPEKIYVLGATDGLLSYNFNYVYDPGTDSWSTGNSMPTARGFLGVAVADDVLYAIGGMGLDYLEPPVDLNEKYTPFGYGTVPPAVCVVSPEGNKTYAYGSVSLAYTVNKPTDFVSYILDGQEPVALTGNTTLTNLTIGLHTIRIDATDRLGNTGRSQTITFTVTQSSTNAPAIPLITAAAIALAIIITFGGVVILIHLNKRKKKHNLVIQAPDNQRACLSLIFCGPTLWRAHWSTSESVTKK
jgi:N-acetylneuraminic acid mutarotase